MPRRNRIPGLSQSRGYWYFRPSTKNLPTGAKRPKPISLGSKDLGQALRRLTELRLDRAGDCRPIEELIPLYIDEKTRAGWAALTATGARACLAHYSAHFGNPAPGHITREMLRAYHRTLLEARSADTAHKYIRTIRAYYSWLVERQLLPEHPFLRMAFPTPRQSRREKFCSRDERDRLIHLAAGDPAWRDMLPILLLGFHAGLRYHEILQARGAWLTLTETGGVLTVTHSASWRTKSNRERQIPLAQPLIDHCSRHPSERDAYLVAPGIAPGAHLYRWNPRRRWLRLVQAAGVPWATYHTMRHTFGSGHAIAGTPEIKIRRWMGITPRTFELHYAGLSPGDAEINNAL